MESSDTHRPSSFWASVGSACHTGTRQWDKGRLRHRDSKTAHTSASRAAARPIANTYGRQVRVTRHLQRQVTRGCTSTGER